MPALVLALWAIFAAPAARAVYTPRLIQIEIFRGRRELAVTPQGRFVLSGEASGASHILFPHKAYSVEAASDGLRFGYYRLGGSARLSPMNSSVLVTAGGGKFRGTLIFKVESDETFTVVDELGVEDYLLGVLPREMEPNWPAEALKAQAVVARTFAYYNLGKYRKSGFDLTSDTRSQVYGGVGQETEAVRQAVAQTRGEVLGYQGELLDVYYHACCGGHTANYAAVWGRGAKTPRPLRGVRDRYCSRSPLARWTAFIAADDVLAAIQARHLAGGKLRYFRPGRRDSAGYVRSFTAKVGGETLTVDAGEFRRFVGTTNLRSLRLSSVRLRRAGVEFSGSGSGHGVGLCQWGARLQAERGRGYEQILDYYFPGSTLSVVDE